METRLVAPEGRGSFALPGRYGQEEDRRVMVPVFSTVDLQDSTDHDLWNRGYKPTTPSTDIVQLFFDLIGDVPR